MPAIRDEFVHHANVDHLRKRLVGATGAERQTLLELLAEEVAAGDRRGWISRL